MWQAIENIVLEIIKLISPTEIILISIIISLLFSIRYLLKMLKTVVFENGNTAQTLARLVTLVEVLVHGKGGN